MKRLALLVVALACCFSACSQGDVPVMSNDSTYVTILVDGNRMDIPLASKWERGMVYSTDKPFVQNDTTFLYREYSYYQCDTCSEYQLDSSSYYIRPKKWKGYLQHLHNYTWYNQQDEYYAEAYSYLRTKCPVQHLQLGDAPRMWYPVVRYRGTYYLSIDDLCAVELTDSVVFYHQMEVALSALRSFRKVGKDSYSWQEEPEYFDGIDTVTIRPVKQVKGLYVMTTVRSEIGKTIHQLVTPEKDIRHFDFIDWRSSDHINDGLEYDTIDFSKL